MKSRRPAWWQLYILLPLMLALLAAQHFLPLPGISDQLVDIGIVLLTFVGMFVWVRLNLGLIERVDLDDEQALRDLKVTVHEPQNAKVDDEHTMHAMPLMTTWPSVSLHFAGDARREERETWSLN